MKIYIAAPWFNPEEMRAVKDVEGLLAQNCIPDMPLYNSGLSSAFQIWSPRQSPVSKAYGLEKDKDKKEIFKKIIFKTNLEELDSSDLVIANIDSKDSGTLWEVGRALRKGIKVVAFPGNNCSVPEVSPSPLDSDVMNVIMDYNIYMYEILSRGAPGLVGLSKEAMIFAEDGYYFGASKVALGYEYKEHVINYVDLKSRGANIMLAESVENFFIVEEELPYLELKKTLNDERKLREHKNLKGYLKPYVAGGEL